MTVKGIYNIKNKRFLNQINAVLFIEKKPEKMYQGFHKKC